MLDKNALDRHITGNWGEDEYYLRAMQDDPFEGLLESHDELEGAPEDIPVPETSRETVRRFYLLRSEDVSGISGTGRVAEGAYWRSQEDYGRPTLVVLQWNIIPYGESRYRTINEMLVAHGHEGKTQVIWID